GSSSDRLMLCSPWTGGGCGQLPYCCVRGGCRVRRFDPRPEVEHEPRIRGARFADREYDPTSGRSPKPTRLLRSSSLPIGPAVLVSSGRELVEIIFVVGQYTMLSMVANCAGIEPEPGLQPLPELDSPQGSSD